MINNSTQQFVPIKDIKEGLVVMEDGSLRTIIMASSINFSLKSEDERKAILFQFQDFLNSLDFSIQIFAESRKLDIRPYVALLEERYKEQTNDLMKIQVEQYINFIKKFTESTSIMTKSFFIVIPYDNPVISTKKSLLDNIPGLRRNISEANTAADFEENRAQLEQRIAVIEQGLVRCGVRVAKLGNEEIVELFYKIFNPGDSEKPIKTS